MIKTLLVADDSTGANASAILLKQLNFTTISLIDYARDFPGLDYDAVAISTDSRAICAEEAHDRVELVLKGYTGNPPLVLNKRIDSTLRGNLGAELNAFWEIFPDRKIAIVPAFPKSGRVCLQGKVYVQGVLLENTDVAKDPKMPITTSDAKGLFSKQFKGTMASIFLDTVRQPDALLEHTQRLYKNHDAIIFDAETNEDIEAIAEMLLDQGISLVTVDPGVFTYYYTRAVVNRREDMKNRFVFVVGSVVDTTYKQIVTASQDPEFEVITIDPAQLLQPDTAVIEKKRVFERFKATSKYFILLTTTDPSNRVVLDLFSLAKRDKCSVDDMSKRINDHLADLLHQILQYQPTIQGVFSSGGDTTLSFLTMSGASGIELQKEVIPLCVFGNIAGGTYDGLQIITKGGMIGAADTYVKIKTFFEEVNQNV